MCYNNMLLKNKILHRRYIMQILILNALKEWILKTFNENMWEEIAKISGIGVEQFRQADSHLTDNRFAKLLANMCSVLVMEEEDLIADFMHYWATDFAPRVYRFYIKKSETAKDFILGIFKVNNYVCKLFPNKILSKVDYQEINENSVTAVYPSEKSLVDIIAVLRGSANFFNDKFTIKKLNPHSVEIRFERG